MDKNTLKPTIIGAIFGLSLALFISLLYWLNRGWDIQVIIRCVNFFVSLPVFLAIWLNLSESAGFILIFSYWLLIGGIFGWLIIRKGQVFKPAVFVLTAGLIVAHWFAQTNLEHLLGGALGIFRTAH